MGFISRLFGNNKKMITSDNIFTLAIDSKFPIKRKKIGEGIRIEATGIGLFLTLYYSNPTSEEIQRIKEDAVCVYFTYKSPVLECVLQVGDDFWGDAPYSAALYHEELPNEVLYVSCIYVCLVDADTEILKSMRIIELPTEMRNFLYNVQKEQITNNMSDTEYEKCIDYIQNNVSINSVVEMANCSVVIKRNNKVTAFIWKDNGVIKIDL